MEPEEEMLLEQGPEAGEGEFDYRDYDEDLLVGIQRTQAIALTSIVCVSFLGNVFVLCSLCGSRYASRPSWRSFKRLLCHLCIGDLAYATLTILPRTINILTFPRFYGGYFVCRLVKFLQLVPVYVCPFLTAACCMERYSNMQKTDYDESITTANRRRVPWRENRVLIHVLSFWAWLGAMVLSAPNILAFRYEYLDDAGTIGACVYQVRESYERLWMTFLTCATWLLPLLFILTLTAITAIRLHLRARRRKRVAAAEHPREELGEMESMKLMKFFTGMIAAKFWLWTPFNITNIIGSYWKSILIGENVSVAVTLASNCSCCIPAIAYVVFEHEYIRKSLAGMFSKCSWGDHPLGSEHSEETNDHSAGTEVARPSVVSISIQPPPESRDSRRQSSVNKPTVVFTL